MRPDDDAHGDGKLYSKSVFFVHESEEPAASQPLRKRVFVASRERSMRPEREVYLGGEKPMTLIETPLEVETVGGLELC